MVFRVLAVGLGLVAVELGAWLLTSAVGTPATTLRRRRATLLAALDRGDRDVPGRLAEVVHPYLGFVTNREKDNPLLREYHGVPVNDYGFLDEIGPVQKRSPDRFVVGIFGGSFASWVFLDAREVLGERLRASGAIGSRDVVVLNLALGGYKQPQQLLALSYVLALGGEFDAVVNIDGFNEIVLPVVENLPKNVNPFFPRNWFMRVTRLPQSAAARATAAAATHKQRRRAIAGWFSAPLVDRAAAANVVWWAADKYLAKRLAEVEEEYLETRVSGGEFAATGPAEQFPDRQAMVRGLTGVWSRSSLQMSHLAEASGALYLHFLQPNQYVERSKPMAAEEEAVALDPRRPFGPLVADGYPALRAAGADLRAAGVDHHDLTGIFGAVNEALYRDSCCHVTPTGSGIVATVVADAIAARLQVRPDGGSSRLRPPAR